MGSAGEEDLNGLTHTGDSGSIVRKTLRNFRALLATKAIAFAINLAASVGLARMLAPADFGVMALAVFYFSLVYRLQDWGLDTALMARQDDLERAASTHLVLTTAFSLVTCLVSGTLLLLDVLPRDVGLVVVLIGIANLVQQVSAPHEI